MLDTPLLPLLPGVIVPLRSNSTVQFFESDYCLLFKTIQVCVSCSYLIKVLTGTTTPG